MPRQQRPVGEPIEAFPPTANETFYGVRPTVERVFARLKRTSANDLQRIRGGAMVRKYFRYVAAESNDAPFVQLRDMQNPDFDELVESETILIELSSSAAGEFEITAIYCDARAYNSDVRATLIEMWPQLKPWLRGKRRG